MASNTGSATTGGDALGTSNSPSSRARGDGSRGRGRGRGGKSRGRGDAQARGGGTSRGRGRGGNGLDTVSSTTPAAPPIESAIRDTREALLRQSDPKPEEADDEGEVCFICANPITHRSIAPCNHTTCHICALRMRALYKNKDCPHCRVSHFPLDATLGVLVMLTSPLRRLQRRS